MVTPKDLMLSIKQNFPKLIDTTNQEAIRIWGYTDSEPIESYPFFEALANILNDEMNRKSLNIDFDQLFEMIRHAYMMGDDETKQHIDVAFVENLFWKVTNDKAKIYWQKLPPILQDLYINFHGQKPYTD